MRAREVLLHLRSSASLRRGLVIGSLIASAGGLVLLQTPRGGGVATAVAAAPRIEPGEGVVSFGGPGAQGTLALSHRALVGPGERRVFAELRVKADAAEARERAPVSMVVALDTSGSMGGAKIEQAKEAVVRLIQEMRDEDEIAFVRYDSQAELVQPVARVGSVRAKLVAQVRAIQSGGGTNISGALAQSLGAIRTVDGKRVRRMVLVSDGLDSSRAQAEGVAREATQQGVAVSSLGVGLDFDESYMASLARVGRGNFAFVKEGTELARFLRQELDESSNTVLDKAQVRLRLPAGMTVGQVSGATAVREGDALVLQLGALFGGEERRVVVELTTRLPPGETQQIQGDFGWTLLRKEQPVSAPWGQLALVGTSDPMVEERSLNGAVMASATSVMASLRQLEAAEAYARGDSGRAQALIQQNMVDLSNAQKSAPRAAASALAAQQAEYKNDSSSFSASPTSTAGKMASKRSFHRDMGNLKASSY